MDPVSVVTAADALRQARSLAGTRGVDAALAHLSAFLRTRTLTFKDYPAWGTLVSELAAAPGDTVAWSRARIAVLGGYTTEPLAHAVRCAPLVDGWLVRVYEGPFDAYAQEILDERSGLHAFAPEAIVLALGWRNLRHLPRGPVQEAEVERALGAEVEDLARLWECVERRLGCLILQHVVEVPEDSLLGSAETELPWSPRAYVTELDRRLRARAPRFVRWLDVDRLAAEVGRRSWFDPRLYHHGKFGFNPRHVPEYARLFLGAWRQLKGGVKKCLVVDLDNTLWGGVIGDDGLNGIHLGAGSPGGEAFRDFAEYVKGLKDRGVILAVCSKNERAIAAEVFDKHPAMPLRLDDFSAFCCNWDDKATNLRRLARELNVDLSSMVFVDDNPAERALVRRELPEVAVVELPDDPSLFRRHVDTERHFDAFMVSAEDLRRTESYAARRQAAELQAGATDVDGYLTSLDMQGALTPATAGDLPRLAQMAAKTNQFNLTTRRYSEQALDDWLRREGCSCLTFRLRDRFTDHGLVSAVVLVREGDRLRIDNWLMSCRVFSRTAEQFMLNGLVDVARGLGVATIVGEYLPTEKNRVVAGLYAALGFAPMAGEEGRWWALDVARAAAAPLTTDIRARVVTR